MKAYNALLVVLVLVLFAPVLTACGNNAEKIAAFCSDWKTAVEDNQNDCAKMGDDLKTVVLKHEDIKLYGRVDDDASKDAAASCQEAVDTLLKCIDDPNVKEAMDMLEAQN